VVQTKYALKSIFVIAAACLAFSCAKTPYEETLRRLDTHLEERKAYCDRFVQSLSPIYGKLRAADSDSLRFVYCNALADAYMEFSIDSVMKYSELMDVYASRRNDFQQQTLARSYTILLARASRNYTEGLDLVNELSRREMEPDVAKKYYEFASGLYYSMMARSKQNGFYLNKTWEEYREELRRLRTGYLSLDSLSRTALLMQYMEMKDDEEYERARDYLVSHKDIIAADNSGLEDYWRQMAVLAPHVGDNNKNLYLALSADYAILSGSRDMLSICELTRQMTDSYQHLKMATRFAYAAADASARYKYTSRVNWAIDSLSIVTEELSRRNARANWVLRALVGILLVLLAGVLLAMFRNLKLRKKLDRSYKELSEANVIKNNYLFDYMIQLSENWSTADSYHKELRRLARSEGTDALVKLLRGPSRFESDRKTFYYEFDKMFFSVFPEFISRVNALMKEGNEYVMGENGMMSTELRVLAIIRLGMTDSHDIARFLGCALSTVFTYRSRAAEKSRLPRPLFEQEIERIPLL